MHLNVEFRRRSAASLSNVGADIKVLVSLYVKIHIIRCASLWKYGQAKRYGGLHEATLLVNSIL